VSVGIVHFLFVGAFLFAAGGLLLARRAGGAASLAAIPLMLGGAGVDLAAISRFATGSHDRLAGQEFAILAAGFALALVALGTRLAAAETSR
jgi:NADH:ubiquinone oxidoreductase subunit K